MGGDDSQKLMPWRGIHSSLGRKLRHNYKIKNTRRYVSNKKWSTRLRRSGLSLKEMGSVVLG